MLACRSRSKYSSGLRGRPECWSASKYSSGCPAMPVSSSRWHRSVLPLRGVAQTRYERVGRMPPRTLFPTDLVQNRRGTLSTGTGATVMSRCGVGPTTIICAPTAVASSRQRVAHPAARDLRARRDAGLARPRHPAVEHGARLLLQGGGEVLHLAAHRVHAHGVAEHDLAAELARQAQRLGQRGVAARRGRRSRPAAARSCRQLQQRGVGDLRSCAGRTPGACRARSASAAAPNSSAPMPITSGGPSPSQESPDSEFSGLERS